MHMADALLSPAAGAVGWGVTLGVAAYSSKIVSRGGKTTVSADTSAAMMGVGAAFVFAAQMINFSIPGTGSSGHLGGGLILAALLGPHAAFIAMASILTVQALFFADGGLLALGCNVFNLGFFPCFVAYPLVFTRIIGNSPTRRRLTVASVTAAVVGLQLGALSVVLETTVSGIVALPFTSFVSLMLPIHLAIGLVEGAATAAVLLFVQKARPDILKLSAHHTVSRRKTAMGMLAAAVLLGGFLSWFASGQPDGLEWSMEKTAGNPELESPDTALHRTAQSVQEHLAPLPDYALPVNRNTNDAQGSTSDDRWPAVDPGTSLAGIVGTGLTLLLAGLLGVLFRRRTKPTGGLQR